MTATTWRAAAATDADQSATRDRDQQAELVIAVARTEALALIKAGKPGRAQYVMARAAMSAGRILGVAS